MLAGKVSSNMGMQMLKSWCLLSSKLVDLNNLGGAAFFEGGP
jgi:hypothetical protein